MIACMMSYVMTCIMTHIGTCVIVHMLICVIECTVSCIITRIKAWMIMHMLTCAATYMITCMLMWIIFRALIILPLINDLKGNLINIEMTFWLSKYQDDINWILCINTSLLDNHPLIFAINAFERSLIKVEKWLNYLHSRMIMPMRNDTHDCMHDNKHDEKRNNMRDKIHLNMHVNMHDN